MPRENSASYSHYHLPVQHAADVLNLGVGLFGQSPKYLTAPRQASSQLL